MNKWYWNSITKEEVHADSIPEGDNWNIGRLPYEYWSEEKKESYRQKRKNINWSEESRLKQSKKTKRFQTDKVGYTNGIINIWLRIGQDIPDGFYRGWTINDPTKYWRKIWRKQ